MTLLKLAFGLSFASMYFENVTEFDPKELLTLSVTSNLPKVLYVTTGFCWFELEGVPPGNVHAQPVGSFVDRSKKLTLNGTQPETGFP